MPKASLEQLLAEQQAALDGVMAEVSLGIRNQRHYDDIEERVTAIATGLRSALRQGAR